VPVRAVASDGGVAGDQYAGSKLEENGVPLRDMVWMDRDL
jgi:hypothetical protein